METVDTYGLVLSKIDPELWRGWIGYDR